MGKLKQGDFVRARCGAPARYLDRGICAFVSSQDNEIGYDLVGPGDGNPALPNLTDYEVRMGAYTLRRLASLLAEA